METIIHQKRDDPRWAIPTRKREKPSRIGNDQRSLGQQRLKIWYIERQPSWNSGADSATMMWRSIGKCSFERQMTRPSVKETKESHNVFLPFLFLWLGGEKGKVSSSLAPDRSQCRRRVLAFRNFNDAAIPTPPSCVVHKAFLIPARPAFLARLSICHDDLYRSLYIHDDGDASVFCHHDINSIFLFHLFLSFFSRHLLFNIFSLVIFFLTILLFILPIWYCRCVECFCLCRPCLVTRLLLLPAKVNDLKSYRLIWLSEMTGIKYKVCVYVFLVDGGMWSLGSAEFNKANDLWLRYGSGKEKEESKLQPWFTVPFL